MLTIDVIYAPTTRQISLPCDSDFYGGATIDSNSVEISVRGINASDFSPSLQARIDIALYLLEGNKAFRPFLVLENLGEVWKVKVPTDILAAAAKTRKFPFQLVLRDGDTVINSRNTLTLDITRAIDAEQGLEERYKPYIMYRDESWAWMEDFTYKIGSVVSHKGELFVSLVDSNLGNEPEKYNDTQYWSTITGPQGEQGPAGEKVSAGDMVIRYVGDGHSLVYRVQHNLGTTKVLHATQRPDGTFIHPLVRAIDEDHLEVTFTEAPDPNEMTMSIYSGGMVEAATYYVHTQDVASTRWEIHHNAGKYVDITVLDTAGDTIEALISQPTLDTAYAEFSEPMTGKAVVR